VQILVFNRRIKMKEMKKIISILTAVMITSIAIYGGPIPNSQDPMILVTTPELKELAAKWSEGFQASNPGEKVMIRDNWSGEKPLPGSVALLQERNLTANNADNELRLVIGRNVVVAVVRASNPYLAEIKEKGLSAGKIKNIIGEKQFSWGAILDASSDTKGRVAIVDDPAINNGLSEFTGKWDMQNLTSYADAGKMFSALDKFSIGFCRLSDIEESNTELILVPIDKNSNGKIDTNEDIYADLSSFSRGVWIGKYPNELISNIYSVTSVPSDEKTSAFLNWIITEGQKTLGDEGYSSLILTERMSGVSKLAEARAVTVAAVNGQNIFRTLIILVAVIASIILIVTLIIAAVRRKPAIGISVLPTGPVLDEKSILVPGGLYFDKTHTWAFMEQDGAVKVGVDDFLLHMTGPVSKVKMKKSGDMVKKGEEILSIIQNGKQLNLYSPVTGIIREHNTMLDEDVSVLNTSPYTSGWIYRMEPENWQRENQLLFMSEKQKQFIKSEIARIKDFLAIVLRGSDPELAPLVLQDGGVLRDGLLADMSPRIWEEFQEKIIDPSRTVWFYEII
jgi:glycine cleavage system H lipoate-binding protein